MSLSKAKTANGERYQVVTARWRVVESNEIEQVRFRMNDEYPETYSLVSRDGGYASDGEIDEVTTDLIIPDYRQNGIYTVVLIRMSDVAGNSSGIYFSELPSYNVAGEEPVLVTEAPATIRVQTRFLDSTPPELDINQITIKAEPTHPDAPNGETRVDISFRIRDNVSGYSSTGLRLRDPQGVMHPFSHYGPNHNLYQINPICSARSLCLAMLT